jgi:monoamine oxidase
MFDSVSFGLTSDQMISIIRKGLHKTHMPKNIIIVGSGMAGLVSASLLKEAGHNVKIVEVSNRVGGRVYTLRSPFSKGLYLDAGAMRIPQHHQLVLEYIRKFQLPVNRFFNTTPRDMIFVNGVKTRLQHYRQNPDMLKYPVAPHEKRKTADELLWSTVGPLIHYMKQNPQKWKSAIEFFDQYSMIDFLRFNPFGIRLSPGAIDKVQVLLDIEAFSELSFLKIFLVDLLPIFLNPNLSFYEITGGNDRLPKAFLPYLQEDLFLGQQVTKIVQYGDKVTVHSKETRTSKQSQFTGDITIVTIPFNTLQFVDIEPRHSFSYYKWRAIRELHYSSSIKTGIEFKSRFWEKEGLYGGKIVTDLPIRFAYFPSHGIGKSGPAVVLASYTWEDDTMPWDSLSQENRVMQALDNFASIFGKQVYREFITGASFSWLQYSYSAGAFTLYKPGQKTLLNDAIRSPEGRVYFAGEHASNFPGWIQGAIESGIRVAYEVNDLPKYP